MDKYNVQSQGAISSHLRNPHRSKRGFHLKLELSVETKDNGVLVWEGKKSPEMDTLHITSE